MSKNRIYSIAYVVIFGLVVGVVSLISARKLIRFYINDEVSDIQYLPELGTQFETDVAASFMKRYEFVNVNGAIHNLLGQREMNGVVKLDNGYLMTPIGFIEDETLCTYADSVECLKDYLEERGTHFLYAVTTDTLDKYNPQIPVGVLDYTHDNADRLMSMVSERGVDAIDFREIMHNEGLDHYSLTYKTDHHWTTEAGLYAYGKLEDYIVDVTGCEVNKRVRDTSWYTIKSYEDSFVGHNGLSTGSYFSPVDDFDLYIPKFETCIQNKDGKTGSMPELLMNVDFLEKVEKPAKYVYDRVYEHSLDDYKNLNSQNDLKILIVTDSYANVVMPYLVMNFSEVRYIWDGEPQKLNTEYLDHYNPDVVILLYYLESALAPRSYNFGELN